MRTTLNRSLISFLGFSLAGAFLSPHAAAQIVPDTTLPIHSIVTHDGSIWTIDGGTEAGSNLFHSFQDFSVPLEGIASFNNSLNIENILTRITGDSISTIDGVIQAQGSANLFLLNPNGIVFGLNAQLNIGGSFFATTADSIKFADGFEYSATMPQALPLLSINVPIGLQVGNTPGSIINYSQAVQNESLPPINSVEASPGLQVFPGQTLALIGGDVNLENGNVTALGGRIEIGSVIAGEVSLSETESGWGLGYENIENFGNISLTQESIVDVSGFFPLRPDLLSERPLQPVNSGAGGSIQIRGQNLTVENSGITTSTLNEAGGDLTIVVSTLKISGVVDEISAGIFAQTEGNGAGGNITINTEQLEVREGGQISTDTFGDGKAGNMEITAREINLLDFSVISGGFTPSGFFLGTEGSGDGGNLTLLSDRLTLRNGALIFVSSIDEGSAGRISIDTTELVEISGGVVDDFRFNPSRIEAISLSNVLGTSSQIQINAQQLTVREGAEITAQTGGLATGGEIVINVDRLSIESGGQILASTVGEGDGGTLTVNANDIELAGTRNDGSFPSGLFTQSQGLLANPNAGQAGDLTVSTRTLTLRDGAAISADTFADGLGGNVTINATDSILVIGQSRLPSIIFSPSRDPDTGLLPSRITAESIGIGDAGSVNLTTDRLLVSDRATIAVNAKAPEAEAGNLNIDTSDLQLRRNSRLATDTQTTTGGNININTDTLAALEDSDITANAAAGRGGRVSITAQGIFGTAFREDLTPASDITATSNLGPEFDGIVEINTPEIDPTRGIVALPEAFQPTPINDPCANPEQEYRFVNTGRGGLPPNPREALNLGVGTVERQNAAKPPETRVLIEAQGWIVGANGEIILVADAPTVTPYSSPFRSPSCGVTSIQN